MVASMVASMAVSIGGIRFSQRIPPRETATKRPFLGLEKVNVMPMCDNRQQLTASIQPWLAEAD
jgi:hypothetical protein